MGPLEGVRVLELAGIGPCPMCAMLLAELGADVLKIDRILPSGLGVDIPPDHRLLERSRRSAAVDLKHPDGVALVLALCAEADILIEGFRPGVTERLGLGPEDCRARNPQSGLWSGHGLGPGGTPRARRRTRPQLHRAHRRARRDRPRRPRTDPASQPGRRLRRGRALSRARGGRSPRRSAPIGTGSGGRCGDDRRRRFPDDRGLRSGRRGLERRDAWHEPARQRCPLLRGVRDPRREACRTRPHRAQVLRGAARTHRRRSRASCRTPWTARNGRH